MKDRKSTISITFGVIFLFFSTTPFAENFGFQEDTETNFKNPERGIRDDLGKGTVDRKEYQLNPWEDANGPHIAGVIKQIQTDLVHAKDNGYKIVPTFFYQWLDNGQYKNGWNSDPDLARLKSHMEKLKPVLVNNKNLIAYFEMGWVGIWGEWHYGSQNPIPNDLRPYKLEILNYWLSILPKDRMVVLRYPQDKIKYVRKYNDATYHYDNPTKEWQAFNSAYPQSRIGASNGCFAYNQSDRGTYDLSIIDKQKDYYEKDNLYVPQTGEICPDGASDYDPAAHDCWKVEPQLKKMRWDVIAAHSYYQDWTNLGCLNNIEKALGYRFYLQNADFITTIKSGGDGRIWGSLTVVNRGYGKLYNPRGIELVLKHPRTGIFYKINLSSSIDPRKWSLKHNEPVKTDFNVSVPAGIPAENGYLVYLNLPDISASLKDSSRFSIRLANKNWLDSKGYNQLINHDGREVKINVYN